MRAQFAGLPRPFWALWSAALANRLGGVVEPFFALYLASRGLSLATVGLLTGLVGMGSLLAQPLGGVLADRVGRRETFAAGMVASAACFGVLAVADALWLIALAATLTGLGANLHRPASNALVADLVPLADRARAYALLFWVVNIGFAFAAAVAGHLAEAGYTLLFVFDAATCLVAAAIIWRGVPGGRGPAALVPGRLAEVLRDRVLVAFAVLTTGGALLYAQAYTTLGLAMREDGLGPAVFGTVIALNGVCIVVLQPLLLRVLASTSPVHLLVVGQVALGAGFGLHAPAESALGYAGGLVVWTVGEILVSSVAPAVVTALAPDHLRGRYQGVWGLSFGVAFVIGPAAGASVLGAAGGPVLWTGCLVLGLVTAAGYAALGPALRARSAV